MNILIIGSGGREHALIWKLRQSPLAGDIFCAPGNAGIAEIATLLPIKPTDITALLDFARTIPIDLTIVGPEQPLMDGIVDRFEEQGLKIFGPRKSAAEIEGSKVFAKSFMKRHGIPTAEFRVYETAHYREAMEYLVVAPYPLVVKADGLAAGKGVLICATRDEAVTAIDSILRQKLFGAAGERIVIEEFMEGEEASLLALTDGKKCLTLLPSQDHKRIFDNDEGKNTGGMGAYAPVPHIDATMMERITQEILLPTIRGMDSDGRTYSGCLYAGLMITRTGPKVVEFNCRFGDPETQVVLPLLDSDLADAMLAVASGNLDDRTLSWKQNTAACIVMASGGYPDRYESGKVITGLDTTRSLKDVCVFHAGTAKQSGNVVTAGGRVLAVTALGPPDALEGAVSLAYDTVREITFEGAYFRNDIGKKGIEGFHRLHQQSQRLE